MSRYERCQDHVWEVEGDVAFSEWPGLRDALQAAIKEGKEIVVHAGLTVRRRDVRAPSSLESAAHAYIEAWDGGADSLTQSDLRTKLRNALHHPYQEEE